MKNLFNKKFRVSSARLQNWNYANEAMYFVTICTKNRLKYFGEITAETQCVASPTQQPAILRPSEIGKIAYSEWYQSIELRPDMNIELGEFVVMPNHIHGVIMIGANDYNKIGDAHGNLDVNEDVNEDEDAMRCVSGYKNQFGPQSKILSSILRGYKSAVTNYARKNTIDFEWQPRFHDHIIRSRIDYNRISDYIVNNPIKWHNDNFFKI